MNVKRYKFEITNIINELNNLELGVFYEYGQGNNRGTASAKTIGKNVKQSFIDLIEKIAEDKPGSLEVLNNKNDD